MLTLNLKDAKAGFSSLVDKALKGEFVAISRHGKTVAVLMSVEAADVAIKALDRKRAGLAAYLRQFPGGDIERNRSPSRKTEI